MGGGSVESEEKNLTFFPDDKNDSDYRSHTQLYKYRYAGPLLTAVSDETDRDCHKYGSTSPRLMCKSACCTPG